MGKRTTAYQYVYRDLICQIYMGTYDKGDYLPSLKELSEIYQVGRNTVRTALQLLEERGYVKSNPRKLTEVTFDMDNKEYQEYYLSELAGRKESIGQAYDFMTLVLPELFAFVLRRLPRNIRMEIANMAGSFVGNLNMKSQQEMISSAFQLYRMIIVLSHNCLMEDLIHSLCSAIIVPVSSTHWDAVKMKAVAPVFKEVFRKFQRQIERGDYKGLAQQIELLCRTEKSKANRYIGRVCKNTPSVVLNSYSWEQNRRLEYIQLATEIMGKIKDGEYSSGEILPSYAELAAEAEVSEKTSRGAIEVLKRLQIVSTINGLGSRVNCQEQSCLVNFLEDLELRPCVYSFIEAVQIAIVLSTVLIKYVDIHITENQGLYFTTQEIQEGSVKLQRLWDILVAYAGIPAVEAVYERLKEEMAWGCLYDCIIRQEQIPLELIRTAGEKRRKECLAQRMYNAGVCYFEEVKRASEQYGVKIQLLPFEELDDN